MRMLSDEVAVELEVEFGPYGNRALEFLASGFETLSVGPAWSRTAEIAAYTIRETLQSLLNSQSPPRIAKDETSNGWKSRSRAVVAAHKAFLLAATLSESERSSAQMDLSLSINQMAQVHEQDDLRTRRLIAVLITRTGARPSSEGLRLVEEYAEVLEEATKALHSQISLEQVKSLWGRMISILETIFMPRTLRDGRLEVLATKRDPAAADLVELRRLILVPGYLQAFLSKLTTPEWLPVLITSGLLDTPKDDGWWVGHTLTAALKEHHADDVIDMLHQVMGRSDRTIQSIYSIAWAAQQMGLVGRPILVSCLEQFPQQVGFLAINELRNGHNSDEYVREIADIILDPNNFDLQNYPNPLLEAMADGLNADNYVDRIKLVVFKIGRVDRSAGKSRPWGRYSYEIGVSVAEDAEFARHKDALWLVSLLCRLIERAAAWATLDEMIQLTEGLASEVAARVRPWMLSAGFSPTRDQIIAEVIAGTRTRRASIDDDDMIRKASSLLNKEALASQLALALPDPPSSDEIEAALRSFGVPDAWIYIWSWSALLSSEVLGGWSDVVAKLNPRYGFASHEQIKERRIKTSMRTSSSFAVEFASHVAVDDLIAFVREWRPTDADWPTSPRDLAMALTTHVEANITNWSTAPLEVVTGLKHPSYIGAYISVLSSHAEVFESNSASLISVIVLLLSEPWPVEPLGETGRMDWDESWDGVERAAITLLIALATADIDFGENLELLLDKLRALAFDLVDVPAREGMDPFQRSRSSVSSLAFDSFLSLGAARVRAGYSVPAKLLMSLDHGLTLEGSRAEEFRAVLATQLPWLSGIMPTWLDKNFDSLFSSSSGDGIGQSTVDIALKWSSPSNRLLERFADSVWNAVARDVENALQNVLIAMLWNLPGYPPSEMVQRLRNCDRLSKAGEALARIISNSPTLGNEEVNAGYLFWDEALKANTDEPMSGFGWFAYAEHLPVQRMVVLLRKTLELSDMQLDAAYKVAQRLALGPISEDILATLDLMVRRISVSYDQQQINASAHEALEIANDLRETIAFKRLTTALQERQVS